jgi:hypothetical protein
MVRSRIDRAVVILIGVARIIEKGVAQILDGDRGLIIFQGIAVSPDPSPQAYPPSGDEVLDHRARRRRSGLGAPVERIVVLELRGADVDVHRCDSP